MCAIRGDPSMAALSVMYIVATAALIALCQRLPRPRQGPSISNKATDGDAWISRARWKDATNAAVHFDAVTKRFGDVVALNGVSLAIGRGRIHDLARAVRCGKTTLLKLAAGFLGPDGGRCDPRKMRQWTCRPTSAGSA